MIFSMLPGIPPTYNPTPDILYGQSLLAGSSLDITSYRMGYDISIPVFNPLTRTVYLERELDKLACRIAIGNVTYHKHKRRNFWPLKSSTFSSWVVKIKFCPWLISANMRGHNKTRVYGHIFKDTCTLIFEFLKEDRKGQHFYRSKISTFTQ